MLFTVARFTFYPATPCCRGKYFSKGISGLPIRSRGQEKSGSPILSTFLHDPRRSPPEIPMKITRRIVHSDVDARSSGHFGNSIAANGTRSLSTCSFTSLSSPSPPLSNRNDSTDKRVIKVYGLNVWIMAGHRGIPRQGGRRGDLFLARLEPANSSAAGGPFDRIVQRARLAQAKSSMETQRRHGHSSSEREIRQVGAPASDSR